MRPQGGWIGRLRRHAGGAVAVEFAIIAIPLIALVIGLVETGRAVHARTNLALAADVALRAATLDPTLTATQLQSAARDVFHGGPPAALTLSLSVDGNGHDVIDVSYPLTLLIPGLTDQGVSLSISRTLP